MFRLSRTQKGPQFTRNDVETIVDKALSRVQEQLGQPVYLTSDRAALVSESELIANVRTALETESTNLTAESLASKLNVSRALVQQLLPRAADGLHGTYIDSVLILPKPRVDALVRKLVDKETSILKVRDLCAQESLTIKSLDYVVKHSKGQLVLANQGEYIVPAATLDSHVNRVKRELESTTSPIKLSSVEPDPVLRELVTSTLGLTSDTFTPQSYVDAKLNSAIKTLEEVGYISFTELNSFEIKDEAKFAKKQNAVIVKDYVVSAVFYNEQKEKVNASLSANRFFDLRDLPLGKRLSDALLADDKTKFAKYYKREVYPHHLVKPSLERDLTAKITKALESDAREAANTVEIEASGSTNAEALLDNVKLPSSTEISERFLADLPEDLPIASRIAPQIRGSYAATAYSVLKQRVEEAVERLDAKILVYLNGVKSVQNPDLRAQVWEEWQQYVSENDYSVPGTEREAGNQFQANPELVTEIADNLRTRTEARLAKLTKVKDTAMILHLAIVVYHARHFVPEKNGLLKIRGKAVPKMLKEFEFPSSFNELKKSLKSPSGDLLSQVKKDAVEA